MKLKLAVIALITILVCGLSVTSISLAPSPALAGDEDDSGGSDGASDGNGTGGGPGDEEN
jgi:hypothetical protein